MNSSQDQEAEYTCPSFSSYSRDIIAEIAVRVSGESSNAAAANNEAENDDEFEFALVREDDEEVFAEQLSQIRPIFPVFNRDLLLNSDESTTSGENQPSDHQSSIMIPLSELFLEDRDDHNSCSSSDADELENVPEGSYCVWRPKMTDSPLPSRCKKSKSTGSASKRWKLPDFLKRSNSDGKGNFVFLTPKNREEKSKKLSDASEKGKVKGSQSAHEAHYIRNRAIKEGDKKKSYLPYRQDLVGFFANVNGLGSKSFTHF